MRLYSEIQIRMAWLSAVRERWRMVVDANDESGERLITSDFVDIQWRWALLAAGVTRYTEAARRKNPALLNYCGIGLAASGLRIGDHLEPDVCVPVALKMDIAKHCLPSTYRMDSGAHWHKAKVGPPEQPEEMGRADIITVVTGAGKRYGDHFAMVDSFDGDKVITFEFNATGELGNGERGRGLVRRTRDVSDVRRVYRLDSHHMVIG